MSPLNLGLCYGYNLLEPSYDSLGGRLLESVNEYGRSFESQSCCQKICTIAGRIFLTIAYLAATALDFLILLGMTITVIPALYIGRTHLVNLICNIASFILGFSFLCGLKQKVDKNRSLYSQPTVNSTSMALLTKAEQKTQAVIATKTSINFDHLLPVLDSIVISRLPMKGLKRISVCIERLVDAGANINGWIKKDAFDTTEYSLIHHLANLMQSSYSYEAGCEGIILLVKTAIKLGANPFQSVKAGTYTLWHNNVIVNCIKGNGSVNDRDSHAELLRFMIKQGIRFDQKLLDKNIISREYLILAAQFSTSEIVALLIEGGANLNFSEEDAKELARCRRLSTSTNHVSRLIDAMRPDASATDRTSAGVEFLCHDCMNQADRLLNQADIIPESEDKRIDWSSHMLCTAIQYGNLKAVNYLLGKYAITWNEFTEEVIKSAGESIFQTILQYKITVRNRVMSVSEFANLQDPAKMIVDYTI